MNTGGYAMLSISFLSESDSIHRKTKIAGDTMTATENQKPSLRTARRMRTRPREGRGAAAGAVGGHVHLVRWRRWSSTNASASTIVKKMTTTADALPML